MTYLRSDRATHFGFEAAIEALRKLARGDPQAMALLQRLKKEDFWPGVQANAARSLRAQSPAK